MLFRSRAPFAVWSIDTIMQMSPPVPDGAHNILVAVDTFTKWVEIGTVPRLDLTHVTMWFHANIVCRYVLPDLVRTDSGAEYKGDFKAYLHDADVRHRLISAQNPWVNRLVERYN